MVKYLVMLMLCVTSVAYAASQATASTANKMATDAAKSDEANTDNASDNASNNMASVGSADATVQQLDELERQRVILQKQVEIGKLQQQLTSETARKVCSSGFPCSKKRSSV